MCPVFLNGLVVLLFTNGACLYLVSHPLVGITDSAAEVNLYNLLRHSMIWRIAVAMW